MLGAYGEVAITLWPGWVTAIPTLDQRVTLTLAQPVDVEPAADTRAIRGAHARTHLVAGARGVRRRCRERAGTIRLMLSPLTKPPSPRPRAHRRAWRALHCAARAAASGPA